MNIGANTRYVFLYDSWGNVLTVTGEAKDTIGQNNPLLYRGYVYDRETKLYYLQSRYYDPEMGRFLNADAYAYTGQGFVGYNMFAYCINNPVLLKDDAGVSGTIALSVNLLGVAASALVNSVASVVSAINPIVALAVVGVAVVAAIVVNAVSNGTSSQSAAISQSNTYNKKSTSSKSSKSQAGAASGGAAAPLPPNDPNKNKTGIGFQARSTYQGEDVHVDWEYNGNGTGNVHLQVKKPEKSFIMILLPAF